MAAGAPGAAADVVGDAVEADTAGTGPDGTGAGDCFTAALTVALLDGRSDEDALRYACAAGALAVSRAGAQPALPWAAELER